jgi:LacI family transcriptional regulator
MGGTAAQLLLKKLGGEAIPESIQVEPELIVRESTAPVRDSAKRKLARHAAIT